MQNETQKKNRNAIWAVAVLAAAGSLMLSCAGKAHTAPHHAAPAQSAAADGWQTDKDAARGFLVTHPAGWTVQADDHSILMQSQDHSQIVLAEGFNASPGETAQAHLTSLAEERAALLPDAQMIDLARQPSASDEVSGTFSYQSPQGPGRGRVLCSIVNGKGLIFVLAAPKARFSEAQPALTRIVKSLRFLPPAARPTSTEKGEGTNPQMAAITRSLHYVTWSDPHEHAFHLEVPQGWKADGGAFRFSPMDVRIAYQVVSPDKSITILMGDSRLPASFLSPTPPFMSALEFNRWYLGQFAGQALDNFKIGAEQPMTEMSRQRTAAAQQAASPGTQLEFSMGTTEFSGRSKLTGKLMTGLIFSTTNRMSQRVGVTGADVTTWFANPMLLICTDNADKVHSQQTAVAVLLHLMQTCRDYPAWDKRRFGEINQASAEVSRQTGEFSRQNIQNSQAASQRIAQNSEATRSASMGAYWNHVNADNEQQRGIINYVGDRTDVTEGSGATVNVQGGSKHYYKNDQTGTVLGTDSAYGPGVDFSPLAEH